MLFGVLLCYLFYFWFGTVFDCWFDCYVLVVSQCIVMLFCLVGWIVTVR